ncbi:MAG: hypothetical protein EOP84_12325 [Verrucomicrobiaceae bacterium]|nr:MAG: hypothetical protein EOP84_12325 [Verrucomicrobiaceae bacterium]
MISKIDAKQLRNAIDRGTLKIGRKKSGVDRWVFTTRECIALVVVAKLTSQTWTPLAKAAEAGQQVACSFSYWGQSWLTSLNADDESDSMTTILEYIAFSENDDVRVAMHKRGADGGLFDLSGKRFAEGSCGKVHILIPFLEVLQKVTTGITFAKQKGAQKSRTAECSRI